MSIVRIANREQWAVISTKTLNDMSISWEAKGLHAYLLGRPDNWTVYVKQLSGVNDSAGKNKVYRMMKELIGAGYVHKQKHSSGDIEYIVFELPQDAKNPNSDFGEQDTKTTKNPNSDFGEQDTRTPANRLINSPDPEKPDPEKPDPQNRPLTSNETKTNIDLKERESAPFDQIGIFPMVTDWEFNNDELQARAARQGVNLTNLSTEVFEEWRQYWTDSGKCFNSGQWHGKLVSWVDRIKYNPRPANGSQSTQNNFIETHTNQDWREGL